MIYHLYNFLLPLLLNLGGYVCICLYFSPQQHSIAYCYAVFWPLLMKMIMN